MWINRIKFLEIYSIFQVHLTKFDVNNNFLAVMKKIKFRIFLRLSTILPVLRLEAGVETRQEWMVCCQGKDSLFCHCAFHIIILNDDIFFQHLKLYIQEMTDHCKCVPATHLDSKHFVRVTLLSQHHFSKGSFSKNFQKSKGHINSKNQNIIR